MRIDVTPAQLAAMAFLADWALHQHKPPWRVIAAADSVGSLAYAAQQLAIVHYVNGEMPSEGAPHAMA